MLAWFIAISSVAIYVIVFFYSWQSKNCFVKSLFEYISPIVGSALTLLGVALTIRANGKTNEMALERNEKNAELIQRRDKQPFIRCDLVERDLEGGLKETRQYDVRVRLFGNNSAIDVSLDAITDSYLGTFAMFSTELLSTQCPEQTGSISIDTLNELAGITREDEVNNTSRPFDCILSFKDTLGNCYWQRYVGTVQPGYEKEGREPLVDLSDSGPLYCEREVSHEELTAYLKKQTEEEEVAKKSDAESKRLINKCRAEIEGFDNLSHAANKTSWESAKAVSSFFRNFYRNKLGGGYGGGRLVDFGKCGNAIKLMHAYTIGFSETGNEFVQTYIDWQVTVLINSRSGKAHFATKKIRRITPDQGFLAYQRIRFLFFWAKPRQFNPAVLLIAALAG